jgi:hypothetical protein
MRTFVLAVFALFVITALIERGCDSSHPSPIAEPPAPPQSNPNPMAGINATKRKNYVALLNQRFHHDGSDGLATDSDGMLIVSTNDVESEAEREQFVSTGFPEKAQEALCDMGFTALRIKSKWAIDGSTFSVACRQTKGQKAAAAVEKLRQREALAGQIQGTTRAIAGFEDATVIARGSELVLTAKGADPAFYQENLPLTMDQQARTNACEMGFRGMRVRRSKTSMGMLIPFGCRR